MNDRYSRVSVSEPTSDSGVELFDFSMSVFYVVPRSELQEAGSLIAELETKGESSIFISVSSSRTFGLDTAKSIRNADVGRVP